MVAGIQRWQEEGFIFQEIGSICEFSLLLRLLPLFLPLLLLSLRFFAIAAALYYVSSIHTRLRYRAAETENCPLLFVLSSLSFLLPHPAAAVAVAAAATTTTCQYFFR